MQETQEDRYYRLKSVFEEVLGHPISREQWDVLFFQYIDPGFTKANQLQHSLDQIRKAWGDWNRMIEER